MKFLNVNRPQISAIKEDSAQIGPLPNGQQAVTSANPGGKSHSVRASTLEKEPGSTNINFLQE